MTTLTADHAAFLAAIRADPADATARLVLADWLDERGDPDGELVRLLCEVQASGYADGPAYDRLEHLTGGLDAVIDSLSKRDQRLFACDCAERVLPLFERGYPGDDRPRRAVEAARRYARGEATAQELAAAGDAAGDAAWNAAWATRAVRAAAARSSGAAAGAAWYAARAAAWDAWDAGASERRWQICRAVEYRLGFVPREGE